MGHRMARGKGTVDLVAQTTAACKFREMQDDEMSFGSKRKARCRKMRTPSSVSKQANTRSARTLPQRKLTTSVDSDCGDGSRARLDRVWRTNNWTAVGFLLLATIGAMFPSEASDGATVSTVAATDCATMIGVARRLRTATPRRVIDPVRIRRWLLLLVLLASVHHVQAGSNIAYGIVPTGDSVDSAYGTFAGATDGSELTGWHSGEVDSCYLVLDFTEEVLISSMVITTPSHSGNYGYRGLEIVTSADGSSWTSVRTDTTTDCSAGRAITHSGLSDASQFVKIVLSDKCGGGHFVISEWEVFGAASTAKASLADIRSLWAEYTFESDSSGSTTITDDSGNGNTASTLSWGMNIQTSGCYHGSCLYLDSPAYIDSSWASSSYSKIYGPILPSSEFSEYLEISFAYKYIGIVHEGEILLNFIDEHQVDQYLAIQHPSGGAGFFFSTPYCTSYSSGGCTTGNDSPDENFYFASSSDGSYYAWHNVTLSYVNPCGDSGFATFSFDGVLQYNGTVMMGTICDKRLWFNRHFWYSGTGSAGRLEVMIDEVKIYNSQPATPVPTAQSTPVPTTQVLGFLDAELVVVLATSVTTGTISAIATSSAIPAGDPFSLLSSIQFLALTYFIDGLPPSYREGYAGSFRLYGYNSVDVDVCVFVFMLMLTLSHRVAPPGPTSNLSHPASSKAKTRRIDLRAPICAQSPRLLKIYCTGTCSTFCAPCLAVRSAGGFALGSFDSRKAPKERLRLLSK